MNLDRYQGINDPTVCRCCHQTKDRVRNFIRNGRWIFTDLEGNEWSGWLCSPCDVERRKKSMRVKRMLERHAKERAQPGRPGQYRKYLEVCAKHKAQPLSLEEWQARQSA